MNSVLLVIYLASLELCLIYMACMYKYYRVYASGVSVFPLFFFFLRHTLKRYVVTSTAPLNFPRFLRPPRRGVSRSTKKSESIIDNTMVDIFRRHFDKTALSNAIRPATFLRVVGMKPPVWTLIKKNISSNALGEGRRQVARELRTKFLTKFRLVIRLNTFKFLTFNFYRVSCFLSAYRTKSRSFFWCLGPRPLLFAATFPRRRLHGLMLPKISRLTVPVCPFD